VKVEEAQRVIDFSRLVTNATDEEFASKMGEFLDVRKFARYMAVTVWLSTLDSILGPGQNYYLYLHPKTHKFDFIPWDLDHSFGQFPLIGSQEQRERLSIHKPWQGQNRFLERVFKVTEFKKLYLADLEELQSSLCRPERLVEQVDELAKAIRPAVQEESAEKLARFDKVVSGEAAAPQGPGGAGPFQPGTVEPVKGFVADRARSIRAQLDGTEEGATMERFGPGAGPGGRGGPGGPGGRGPGAPGDFGPGMFLGPVFMRAMDSDKDGSLTRDEFTKGFAQWFATWDQGKTGALTDEALREGINKEFTPRPGG
jgi:hypothetical protein